ncbi:membrane bound c2 domain containing protein [Grosmannia clavigera kw1407]|uniref:Membrane bound c2 domain containing protein n=1 Tax=Grosmannia clavigera (strain kw1407 / UAMH 11150) TaxID=655863 RepID=F0XHF3_GROCL|nr:membrane bound c2 domain containing protein [Grosmannia clavigera kw1407]EFX02579.1 membrane bound c2 domain containing protein [Grosmannia clavigera kw1407]
MAATTEKAAGELKQQGAIEAAQRSNGTVTSTQAQAKIVQESNRAGVMAFNFDPDASPEAKRAQVRAAVPEGFHNPKHIKGLAVATDIDDGTAPAYDLPTPSKAGAIDVSAETSGLGDGENGVEMGPDTTGWAPRFGWPYESIADSPSMLEHSTWLEGQIPDKFFGDWYYNAGVIVFACLSSWFVAVLGGGLGWVLIIMAGCSTYYRTSVRRVRRNFRDDLNRELSLKRLETDTESLEWINSFLLKFWPIYQPVLAQTIINSVDQVLSGATPSFLDSLKLSSFTLGSKPPRMEHVKTYPKVEDDIVVMDWKFSFTPNDTADMTARQIQNKINPKVVLEIRIGKAMISKGMDVIVEDFAFSGIMRLKIKLQIAFPHIEKVEMCFLEKPSIDYVCKPLGGETFGIDINFVPGLESFILEQIHGNLAPMMYAPNVFPIEVAKMLSGSPVDQAIGVLAITIHGAQGLKNTDSFAGNVDPYAVITLNRRQPLAQTKTIRDTNSPRWNETHYIIITSFNDSLDIIVYDFNDFRKDKELGVASFSLEDVEEINEFENESLEIIAGGKARGNLSCDVRFFPVLEAEKGPDGKVEPLPPSNTGILRFTVEQAKDLDGTKSLVGQLNPYASLLLNGKEIHTTKKLKRTNNPIWDNGSKEILITDRKAAKMGVVIKDERDLAGDQIMGTYQIKLEDMLEFMEKGQDWYSLAGAKSGRVKMQAQWRPVTITGVSGGTGGYQIPIGVIRLHFIKGSSLRNFEKVGKSDPYVRVLLSGIEKARTVTFKNNLDPEWDEVLYIPVHSTRERLQLEVMDAESMGRDRSLGLVEVVAGDYISEEEDGSYAVNDTKMQRDDGLRMHGKGMPKGILSYTVSFFPCLNVADPEDEEEEKEAGAPKDAAEGDASATAPAAEAADEKAADASVVPANGAASEEAVAKVSAESKGLPKIRLTPEELLKYESGLVIFKLMEAELPKSDTQIEIFVDDMAFPSYISSKAASRTFTFDEMGDCFIRELDFSRLTLKVHERGDKKDDDKDRTLARLTGNTLDTLKQCLNNPTTLMMKGEDGKVSTVKISLKYIPVRMQLDPSESINNMGNLRVDILDGRDLPAADTNGKSDPYCKFELNGQEVFKSKVQKKTLNPVWNEFFEVVVPSRTGAKFAAKVYDYDFADKPDFLGGANIRLDQLEPFKAQELTLPLDGKSGSIRVRLLFRPDYITRMKQGTSTFSGTFATPGKIVTGVAGAPIKGGAAVVGVVGLGVGKGASFLRRGFKGKRDDDANGSVSGSSIELSRGSTVNDSGPAVPSVMVQRATGLSDAEPLADSPPGPAVNNVSGAPPLGGQSHSRTRSMGASSVHSVLPGSPGAGQAVFTIVAASEFPPSTDVYVVLNQLGSRSKVVGKTKHHKASGGAVKFDETFKLTCTPDTQFQIQAREHHSFGSDETLGESLYVVDESGTNSEKEIRVGDGVVVIKSNFTPNETSPSESPKSTFRRSFLSKRDARAPSRDGTPT